MYYEMDVTMFNMIINLLLQTELKMDHLEYTIATV